MLMASVQANYILSLRVVQLKKSLALPVLPIRGILYLIMIKNIYIFMKFKILSRSAAVSMHCWHHLLSCSIHGFMPTGP